MNLVSCLCVTYNRSQHLKKAVECFLAQTYTNTELVVICDQKDTPTIRLLEKFQSHKIKIYPQEDMKSRTLGDIRNVAINNAIGDFICNWDDDDWSNVDRIEMQIAAVYRHKKQGCILTRLFIHNEVNNVSFLSYRRMWENTILVNKRYIIDNNIAYPSLNSHEDYEFVNLLMQHNALYPLEDAMLYIYRYTGQNTCTQAHFERLFGYSFSITNYQSIVIAKAFSDNVTVAETAKRMYTHNFQATLAYAPYVEGRA